MFLKKVQLGTVIGTALGVLAIVGSLLEGKSLWESLEMLPVSILMCLGLTFWFTRNMGRADDMGGGSGQVRELQKQLRKALDAQALMERSGNPQGAAYWRSEAAVLESQLRRLGA